MFRAKLYITGIVPNGEGRGATVTFNTQYDPEVPEDQRFALATPSGFQMLQVTNPVVLEQLKVGQVFYQDFTEVPRA